MGKSLLVFGAGGQLGRELLRAAPPAGYRVQGATRGDADITRDDQVAAAIDRTRPALVINAAAYTAVDKAESEPEAAFAVNRDGAAVLAAACRAADLPLIQVSTDYVFDGTKQRAYREDDPVAPLGVYGASKEAGERAVREGLDRHIILRTAWVFGAFGGNFVKTMLRLAETRDALGVVDDQTGCPSPARAIAETILTIAGTPNKAWGTYHFAGQPPITWHGFAKEIFAARQARTGRAGPKLSAITTADYPTAARRPANSVLDGSKLTQAFGIEPADWRAGLADVLDEILPQQAERQAQ
ncbi:MAG: dTDP-4-dehydrorhamnose reductase [Pseudomonadota bacterium]